MFECQISRMCCVVIWRKWSFSVWVIWLKCSLALLTSSDDSFHSSIRHPARITWSWLVYGEIMFFPLLDFVPSRAHWNTQRFGNPSVTRAISMFLQQWGCEGLGGALCFYHHDLWSHDLCHHVLVWHQWTPFYRPSVPLNQLILICTDKGKDSSWITDWFQPVSWFSMPVCTSLSC